jgi:DNA-binding GntR family transcriptional regulator
MASALEALASRIRFFRRVNLEVQAQRTESYQEHAAIIEALRRRDAAKGAAILQKHITLSSAHAIDVATRGLALIFFGKAA